MNKILEEFYLNARVAARKKWKLQTTDYDVAEELTDAIVRDCAQVIQGFVDQRIPASEYPNLIKTHFGIDQ